SCDRSLPHRLSPFVIERQRDLRFRSRSRTQGVLEFLKMTQVSVSDARLRVSAGSSSDNASRREAQILAAATVLMTRKGLAFSTRELADAVGVSQPLIYRYFPSKATLLDRVFEEIYVKRWDAFWTDILRDRSIPLSERL